MTLTAEAWEIVNIRWVKYGIICLLIFLTFNSLIFASVNNMLIAGGFVHPTPVPKPPYPPANEYAPPAVPTPVPTLSPEQISGHAGVVIKTVRGMDEAFINVNVYQATGGRTRYVTPLEEDAGGYLPISASYTYNGRNYTWLEGQGLYDRMTGDCITSIDTYNLGRPVDLFSDELENIFTNRIW